MEKRGNELFEKLFQNLDKLEALGEEVTEARKALNEMYTIASNTPDEPDSIVRSWGSID